MHFKCHSPFLFLSLFNAVTTNSSWMITTDTCTHASHCSSDLVKLSFAAFVAPTLHFLHRHLISSSNWYLFPTPTGGRSSGSDQSKMFSILFITALPNPFIWRFSMKGFVSWPERYHENFKVFVFFISSKFFRHQTALLVTLIVSRMVKKWDRIPAICTCTITIIIVQLIGNIGSAFLKVIELHYSGLRFTIIFGYSWNWSHCRQHKDILASSGFCFHWISCYI